MKCKYTGRELKSPLDLTEEDMIKVSSQVKNYDDPAKADITVHSHWDVNRMVVLQFGPYREKDCRTVLAEDLKSAIDNACNVGVR